MSDVDRIIADLQASQPERDARLRAHRATGAPVCHTIRNDDTALTYCGRLLFAAPNPSDSACVRVLGGGPRDGATWDDVELPAGMTGCRECSAAYHEEN